jgi:hypothetical protein
MQWMLWQVYTQDQRKKKHHHNTDQSLLNPTRSSPWKMRIITHHSYYYSPLSIWLKEKAYKDMFTFVTASSSQLLPLKAK